jgi:hypothetical protein
MRTLKWCDANAADNPQVATASSARQQLPSQAETSNRKLFEPRASVGASRHLYFCSGRLCFAPSMSPRTAWKRDHVAVRRLDDHFGK